ncbi:hypothetical protein [Streptomyces sp. NPDC001820]|uniref:hypothetical protein n=1 Tax=Streptomyces sp. NPDC001820 TaxID=3364613 RepID=UPI0036C4EDA1
MKRPIALLCGLAICAGPVLLGCSHNECNDSSVCGDGNSNNRNGSEAPKKASGPPFTFTSRESDPWDACENGPGRVYPKAPPLEDIAAHVDIGAARTSAEVAAHNKRLASFDSNHSAVTADRTTIDLTLQGKTGRAVTIQNISVDVVDVKPTPATGVRVRRIGGCGGSNFSAFLADLDKKTPTLAFKSGENAAGKMRVRGFPVQVTESDPETFTIVAFTTADVHTFSFVVEWSSEGVRRKTKVNKDNGTPFSVASGNGAPQYDYQQQDGTFTPPQFKMNPDDPLGDPVPIEDH